MMSNSLKILNFLSHKNFGTRGKYLHSVLRTLALTFISLELINKMALC